MNKKERRHSGRVTPRTTLQMKYASLLEGALEPQEFWNDWRDYRDGLRGCKDRTKIRSNKAWWLEEEIKKYNKKNKQLLRRRKIRKKSLRNQ